MAEIDVIYDGYPAEGIHYRETSKLRKKVGRAKRTRFHRYTMTADTAFDFINFTKEPGYVERPEGNYLHGDAHHHTSSKDHGRWAGTKDYETWMHLLFNGWQNGAKSASKLADELAPFIYGTKQIDEQIYGYEGDAVDIDRYLEGDPECMLGYEESRATGAAKFVKVAVDMGATSEIKAEALLWRGIIAAALVDLLENNGYRCEVIGYCHTSWGVDWESLIVFPVKKEDQPVDLERLASLVGHAASFRRGIFSAMEKLPYEKFSQYHGYGYGRYANSDPYDDLQADLYIGRDCLCSSAQDAAERFREKLGEIETFRDFLEEEGLV